MVSKIKTADTKGAMARHQAASSASASDRFAAAAAITENRPTGLALPGEAVSPAPGAFSIASCIVGRIVSVPLSLIDANPLSPRHIYQSEEIDKIATTMPQGQDVAAHGYVKDARIQLIDGGTRLRAARITDRGTLDVKIEVAPANDLELFARARALNEQRSPTTGLDFALSLKTLLDRGAVSSQEELARVIKSPDGAQLSPASVSVYLKISRMPERIQRAMAERPETSSTSALYAVSEIFEGFDQKDEARQQADLEAAISIVDEVKRRQLNRAQITALVKAYLQGPKTRDRSALTPLEFGAQRGQIKVFGKKGQIDLSLKGLPEAELPAVRSVLVKALEDYMKGRGQGD